MADGSTPIDTAQAKPARVPDVALWHNDQYWMVDTKGRQVPLDAVKPAHLLEDEAVREIMAEAVGLNAQLAAFKESALGKVAGLLAVFDQEYGVTRGGTKGNVTLTSYDGTKKVVLAIADQVTFGPELQSAKTLVDECLNEWSADSRPELQAIVQRAFNTDKEGLVNRAELFSLLRLEIKDERWVRAMQAIRDSIRVTGSKEYVRFYERKSPLLAWTAVTIDLASAK